MKEVENSVKEGEFGINIGGLDYNEDGSETDRIVDELT
jgi:hypothetical protein